MKRETLRHPKTYDLAARLNIGRPQAIGHLQLLLEACSEIAPCGNIGKWPNGAIARACDWMGDPNEFVAALVMAGWLDVCEVHRLVIHDLADHAEQWWKQKLTKLGLEFVEAKKPAVASTVPTVVGTSVGTAERTDPRGQSELNPESVASAVPVPSRDRTEPKPNLNRTQRNAMSGSPPDVVSLTPLSGKPNGHDYRAQAREVLDFLNAKTGKRFRPVEVNLGFIVARLKEGATLEECRAIIARKFREWSTDEKMAKYLRPSTLFNREKFAQYQGEIGAEAKRYGDLS